MTSKVSKTISLFALAAGILLAAGPLAAQPAKKAAKGKKDDPAKRGQYLVLVGGCNHCHTPMKMTPIGPAPDMERMLSGRPEGVPDPTGTLGKTDLTLAGPDLTAFKFPFGVVYAQNLTPDETGLGKWTEEQFLKALRTGKHQGDGRPILPPMPWMDFGQMPDEDLKAIWAYLRTIKPIKNKVADPKVPPPVLEQFAKTNAAILEMHKGKPGGK